MRISNIGGINAMQKKIDVSKEESLRQKKQIMDKLSEYIKVKKLKYHISTFGCQMNAHDSEKLRGF